MKKPFIIGEVSANHNGKIEQAKKIISLAKNSGLSAVKLQTYTPGTMTINSRRPDFIVKKGIWKGNALWNLYQKAQTPFEWQKELFIYAKKVGMKDVFAHGMLIMAYLGRALTNIIPQSNLKNLNTKFCSITNVGDVLTCSGSVSNIHNRNSKVMIVFDIMVADETGDIKIIGTATIEK